MGDFGTYWPRIVTCECMVLDSGMIKFCTRCGACPHEPHTEECSQEWRTLILSYISKKENDD